MEDTERVKQQLKNLQGVEPILSSMRTIAAGSWRAALARLRVARRYVEHLEQTLGGLLDDETQARLERSPLVQRLSRQGRVGMLVVASERGLCGAYNDVVLEGAERLIAQQRLRSQDVVLMTLGARADSYFRRRGYQTALAEPLPVTRVPGSDRLRTLSDTLLQLRQEQGLDALYVLHAPYQTGSLVPPVAARWLPADVSALRAQVPWPTPISETERRPLFERALGEWIHARFYQLIIEAAASEQAARFRAMDAASSNLARQIEELTQSYHTARQHAITMQMLDLVAGSGILDQRTRGTH